MNVKPSFVVVWLVEINENEHLKNYDLTSKFCADGGGHMFHVLLES
jgi:hypothetical protein